jgi:hypothetical protein
MRPHGAGMQMFCEWLNQGIEAIRTHAAKAKVEDHNES